MIVKHLLILLVVLLSACSTNSTTYFLKSESASGIHVQMPIMYHGDSIGSVTGVGVVNDQLIATIELKNSINVCNSSTFKMVELDFFNSRIELNSSCNKKVFEEGDTILVDLNNLSKQKNWQILTPEMIKRAQEEIDTIRVDSLQVIIGNKK